MDLSKIAEFALNKMTAIGFDAVQVSASIAETDELNLAHDEASLLRSTEDYGISLLGIVGGRKASAALTDVSEGNIEENVAQLFERAGFAPEDDANAVSAGEVTHIERGPQSPDLNVLADKVKELLEFRAAKTPKMALEEGAASHTLSRRETLTSEGSKITTSIGYYTLSAMGTASDGENASSFNYAGGSSNDLSTQNAVDFFGIGDMLTYTEQQIDTHSIPENFVGDVVLAPGALGDLIGWLFGQLSDMQLISDSSLYKDKVGELIASPLLSVCSRFDGPGCTPVTGDAFIAEPVKVLDEGRLTTLLPGLYGSRKTGIEHRPTGSGWVVPAGDTDRSELIASIKHGALVNRLSMGSPGPNGDFSGVIKNSFLIRDGAQDIALSEVMISGNVAEMLRNINGVSREHIDEGSVDLPWVRVPGLHFS